MTQAAVQVEASFSRSGIGLFVFGLVMSFGIVGHYIAGAHWPTGAAFLQSITLWFACPWTLSTSVMLIGAVGMIAIGAAYASLGRSAPDALPGGVWLLLQLACMVVYMVGVILAASGVKRLSRAVA